MRAPNTLYCHALLGTNKQSMANKNKIMFVTMSLLTNIAGRNDLTHPQNTFFFIPSSQAFPREKQRRSLMCIIRIRISTKFLPPFDYFYNMFLMTEFSLNGGLNYNYEIRDWESNKLCIKMYIVCGKKKTSLQVLFWLQNQNAITRWEINLGLYIFYQPLAHIHVRHPFF